MEHFYPNIQKARISRNPKTGEKVHTPEKKTIHFKMAKDLFKKLNNEKKIKYLLLVIALIFQKLKEN